MSTGQSCTMIEKSLRITSTDINPTLVQPPLDRLAMNDKWDGRFLDLADTVAQWSKDPRKKVGAVIVDDKKRVVSLGFNGFPRGASDSALIHISRDVKLKQIIHAEMNAILFAKQDLTGCTIYVSPLAPCAQCASVIIQSGITRVVSRPNRENSKWIEHMKLAQANFKDANVSFEVLDFHSR